VISAAECAHGTEANGKTYLQFVTPRDSGDSRIKPLIPGRTCRTLSAYHETNDGFSVWHSQRGSGSIMLRPHTALR
jgi:hypothetical protein